MIDDTDFGDYRIVGPLGRGGMGQVFLGHDVVLDRPVAIKLIVRADAAARERFLIEARAIARLAHPNVVAVYRAGETRDGRPYLVQELVRGQSLDRVAAPLPAAEVRRIGAAIASGLAAAHAAGVLHRDLKPGNVMLADDGAVKILDFGLAKLTPRDAPAGEAAAPIARASATPAPGTAPPDATPADGLAATADGEAAPLADVPAAPALAGAELTRTGAVLGTPRYMAPEQWRGEAATARTDLYALGALLFELATGRPVHPHRDAGSLEAAVTARDAPAVATLAPGLDPALAGAIDRALRRDPAERLASAEAMAEVLRAAPATAAIVAVPRRRRALALGAGGVVAAVAVAVAALTLRGGGEAARPTPAISPAAAAASTALAVQGRALASGAGCARTPVFVDDDRLAYALVDDDAGDLYLRDLATGAERPLTRTPAVSELAPQPVIGAAALTYMAQAQGSGGFTATRLPLDGAPATAYPLGGLFMSPGVLAIGDDLLHVVGGGATLARLRGTTVSEVLKLPGRRIFTMAPSVTGRFLVIDGPCVVDLAATPVAAPACVQTAQPAYGRLAIDGTGDVIYYGAPGGIRRFTRSTGADALVVEGAGVNGGLALAPSGRRLAWSDCQPQITLTDLATGAAVHAESLTGPTTNTRGDWAFVRETPSLSILAFREPGGLVHELTAPPIIPGHPALEPDGERVVFGRGDVPGLHLAWGTQLRPIERLTDDPSDDGAVWIGRDRVAFTRTDAAGVPAVWTVDVLAGRPAVATGRARRQVADAQPGGGQVLLLNDDRTRLYLWDPATGDEREVPQPAAFHGALLLDADLAPDGRHVVVLRGPEVWRFAIDGGAAERLWVAPAGHGCWGVEVDARDHVIVADARDAGRVYVADLP
ncbi:MAG: serine/threonine protein kinase [Myxococcales bacterium]|nr:serine/threonine protein kinase [Myxococcales bacterium]MBK7194249.1 serine/threonine protein kinase [Myxococcales bacterium]